MGEYRRNRRKTQQTHTACGYYTAGDSSVFSTFSGRGKDTCLHSEQGVGHSTLVQYREECVGRKIGGLRERDALGLNGTSEGSCNTGDNGNKNKNRVCWRDRQSPVRRDDRFQSFSRFGFAHNGELLTVSRPQKIFTVVVTVRELLCRWSWWW